MSETQMIPKIDTIDNAMPHMAMEVEHVVLLPELCPASKNPKPGSTLTITYAAGTKLLELFSLEKYIHAYIGHTVVRDMEFFTQTVAQAAANVLQNEIKVVADIDFNMISQRQRIRVIAQPETL